MYIELYFTQDLIVYIRAFLLQTVVLKHILFKLKSNKSVFYYFLHIFLILGYFYVQYF